VSVSSDTCGTRAGLPRAHVKPLEPTSLARRWWVIGGRPGVGCVIHRQISSGTRTFLAPSGSPMEGVGLRLPDFASLLLRRCPPLPTSCCSVSHLSQPWDAWGASRQATRDAVGPAQLHAVARSCLQLHALCRFVRLAATKGPPFPGARGGGAAVDRRCAYIIFPDLIGAGSFDPRGHSRYCGQATGLIETLRLTPPSLCRNHSVETGPIPVVGALRSDDCRGESRGKDFGRREGGIPPPPLPPSASPMQINANCGS
jgi:hypothetical protein